MGTESRYIAVIVVGLMVIATIGLVYGFGQSSSTTSESRITNLPNSVSTSLSPTLSTLTTSTTFISPPPPQPISSTTAVSTINWNGTNIVTVGTATSPPPYTVTFQQLYCAGDIGTPWSVTLGNTTVVNPPGASVPPPNYGEIAAPKNNQSGIIVFTDVMPRTYSYTILPTTDFGDGTGTVTVTGPILVQLLAPCHP